MKKIKYSLPFVLLIFLMGSCTKDFEEMNTDPNLPVAVPLANHLAGAMISFDGGFMVISDGKITINTRYVGGRWGSAYDPDVSNTYGNMTSAGWGGYYTNLVDFNDIIAKATEAEAYNMVAAALTYRANMTQIATDRWGDMPYSESCKAGEDVLRPAYDTQVSIYNEIISDLKTAADYFRAGHTDDIGSVDPLYSGDVYKWQKLCNSLRLRVA
ncbi:MAG: SusD/RagB family nutrient-binding outer membrane lipoprotein, partial [Bacteroidetes bacterium]|nr:SusD/RagB family nutrient-binding outer membrane lipoprotein [Bacteroidota bacterium]